MVQEAFAQRKALVMAALAADQGARARACLFLPPPLRRRRRLAAACPAFYIS